VRVPTLVVGPPGELAAIREALSTGDVVAGPLDALDPDELTRRVQVLTELGAAWLSLELYERTLGEGVTGLTVAEPHGSDLPIVYASPAFERLTGYAAEEALGRDCRFLQHDGADPQARERLRQGIRHRTRTQVVIRNVRKDGTPFWNEVTIFPFRAQDVELPFFGGVQHDVTELVEARARAESLADELAHRVAFDEALLDALDVGVLTADDGGLVTFANRAARELIPDESIAGRTVAQVLGLRADPCPPLGDESSTRFAHTLSGRDVEISVRRVAGAQEARLARLVFLRDVTGEHQLQEEMRRVERLAAMGTMVAGFAHEVRNPVASLRAIAEQLDEDLAEIGQSLPHASRMLKVLGRIEALVDTSLRFGRPATPRRAEHRPWQLLSAALTAVLPRTRAMGGEVRVEVEPDLPSVYVDEGQLVQVLVILIDNALDVTLSPRRVTLRALSMRGDPKGLEGATGVRFDVIDDGPGIPAHAIGRIFDPFFTTKPSGTGLGLSIAQQLVAENGGRIELTSTAGGPTTFSIRFDLAPPPSSRRLP
jgi:PAS domain S-box-containing protein